MVEIRMLPTDRWRDYKKLRLESLRESPLAFGASPEEEASSGEREWRKHMKQVSFAMNGSVPVGMIVCVFSEGVKFRHIAEIYSFYVKPNFRGKGIGKQLLDHAIGRAVKNGRILKIRLYVNASQRGAIGLYKKSGFLVVGTLESEMRVGRRLYTMLVMEKALR